MPGYTPKTNVKKNRKEVSKEIGHSAGTGRRKTARTVLKLESKKATHYLSHNPEENEEAKRNETKRRETRSAQEKPRDRGLKRTASAVRKPEYYVYTGQNAYPNQG